MSMTIVFSSNGIYKKRERKEKYIMNKNKQDFLIRR